jgi:hypothetical protein
MELVTAIVVLGVGVLGIVALYLDRVHEQAENPRGIATTLAEELAASIATHASAGTATDFENGLNAMCETSQPVRNLPPPQIAACWQSKVEKMLPNGSGTVERVETGRSVAYRVVVSWSEAGVGAASYVMTVPVRSS